MISINATLIVQILNLLILMWILNKILYQPIFKIIDERNKTIEDSIQEVGHLKEEAQSKVENLENQMKEARSEAAQRRIEVTSLAADEANLIIQKAQDEAAKHMENVQQKAEKQVAEAKQSLDELKGAIIDSIFLKVMGRKV